MSIRRLHPEQPESFAFTEANLEWAEAQIAKFPEGRQMSAVIPLLWRAQEQEGWVTRPMIHEIGRMLNVDPIRVLEVASFYFGFHLQPVGSVAHIQVCGTTSCMILGAEDLVRICRERIAPEPYELSADGKFSWDEVECLGACSNAPMMQIGKDYYEDLTEESFNAILDALERGEVPRPGPQNGRWASEPVSGRTTLAGEPDMDANASVSLALEKGDTISRITGDVDRDRMPTPGAAERPGEPAGSAAPDAVSHTQPTEREEAEQAAPLPSDDAEIADEAEKQAAAERQSNEALAKGRNGTELPPQSETGGAGSESRERDGEGPDTGRGGS